MTISELDQALQELADTALERDAATNYNRCLMVRLERQAGIITELRNQLDRCKAGLTLRAKQVESYKTRELVKKAASFTVVAGRYDSDGSEECQFAENYLTIDEAIPDYQHYQRMPWARIEYRGGQLIYAVELRPLFSLDPATGLWKPV